MMMNMKAGKRAADRLSHQTAYSYFHIASSMLPQDQWENQYDLTLQLSFLLASAANCSCKYDEAQLILQTIIRNARNPQATNCLLTFCSVTFSKHMENLSMHTKCIPLLYLNSVKRFQIQSLQKRAKAWLEKQWTCSRNYTMKSGKRKRSKMIQYALLSSFTLASHLLPISFNLENLWPGLFVKRPSFAYRMECDSTPQYLLFSLQFLLLIKLWFKAMFHIFGKSSSIVKSCIDIWCASPLTLVIFIKFFSAA